MQNARESEKVVRRFSWTKRRHNLKNLTIDGRLIRKQFSYKKYVCGVIQVLLPQRTVKREACAKTVSFFNYLRMDLALVARHLRVRPEF